ncbi:peptide chain release factor N(5)-glutamine methyltransferase [Micrococcus lylae]|uniref:Peptide chain release factor N(5)-glutamine methyltransferase n=1 Tax=Micrococcus lylae TaxID=1273 RepID=A0ABY2K2C7_9MICC|nr:HemK/PrmC family methyltransferase [Micrococcus lylae]MCT2006936.1 peptide chain release factor N(5)-glutamine methyltransferase [Micrococcus lylae]MCT2070759.1 peptide chain release factor N(5)-glutamine methyltransferase [Micrococcus lylae]TFI01503.1 peptide chain release factor N(5)-glutamine methyltransferase [Micrococcus lylae]
MTGSGLSADGAGPASGGALPQPATTDWHLLVRGALRRLSGSGVDSPRADAEQLAAHVMGLQTGAALARILAGARASADEAARYGELVARRVERVPLQHLTGEASFHGVCLQVGPGVFLPRPETELLVEHTLAAVAGIDRPVLVDLCTGSGAVAAALAHARAETGRPADVHAVELDPTAHRWAARNLEPLGVHLVLGDAAAALSELDGTAHAVTVNPPYVPDGRLPAQPEARLDPALALYGGDAAGTRIPLTMATTAARLLRTGGVLTMEHDETHGPELVAAVRAQGAWADVVGHEDLTGRPRWLHAVRA